MVERRAPMTPAEALAELIAEQRELAADAGRDLLGARRALQARTGNAAAVAIADESYTAHRARLDVLLAAERALLGRTDT